MPDPDFTPVQNTGLIFEELGDEAVVYDRIQRRAVHLNETATVVWKLCDGQRNMADISALLTQEFTESAADIERDIAEAVDSLVASRIMTLIAPR